MILRPLLHDIRTSPRPPAVRPVEVTLSSAMFHRLPEAARAILLERHCGAHADVGGSRRF